MAKLTLNLGKKIRSSPMLVLLVFFAWVGLCYISMRLLFEDYNTSVHGYMLMPTQKLDQSLPYLIALLPTLLQVACGTLAIEKGNRVAALLAIVSFLIDSGTDVYFKADGALGLNTITVLASVETAVLFTIGSEFLFVMSSQNIVEYFPDAIAAIVIVFGKIGEAVGKVVEALSSGVSWLVSGSNGDDERVGRSSYR